MPWTLTANVTRNPKQSVKLMNIGAANTPFCVILPDWAQDERRYYGMVIVRFATVLSGLISSTLTEQFSEPQWASYRLYYSPTTFQVGSEVWFYVPEGGIPNLRIRGYRFDP